jgi:hypothetical protein
MDVGNTEVMPYSTGRDDSIKLRRMALPLYTKGLRCEGLERILRLKFGTLYLGIQAGTAPTLLEPNFLAGTNILSHIPPVVLQGFKLIAVGTEPQRNTLPLAVRFRQRDWHMGTSILSNHPQVGS